MVPFLYTHREHHSAKSGEEYLARHAAFIARKRKAGQRFSVHESPGRLQAHVDANTWLVDCECGAGNATSPELGFACCFSCGAIHHNVVFPEDHALIEALLVARPHVMKRGWDVGQTVVAMIAENVSVAAEVPDHVVDAVVADREVGL